MHRTKWYCVRPFFISIHRYGMIRVYFDENVSFQHDVVKPVIQPQLSVNGQDSFVFINGQKRSKRLINKESLSKHLAKNVSLDANSNFNSNDNNNNNNNSFTYSNSPQTQSGFNNNGIRKRENEEKNQLLSTEMNVSDENINTKNSSIHSNSDINFGTNNHITSTIGVDLNEESDNFSDNANDIEIILENDANTSSNNNSNTFSQHHNNIDHKQ